MPAASRASSSSLPSTKTQDVSRLTTSTTIDKHEDKVELDHIERTITQEDPIKVVTEHSADLSKYAHLTFGQTLRQFWRAMAISFGCGILAMGDGYQYKMPGNIVALEGFIRQMGYQLPDGKWKLDPNHVAAWGGVYAGAVILVLLVGNWPLDYLGRRPMLIAVQVFMLIAAIIEMFATNWTHWLAAKILNGLSVGCNQMTATTYIAEIAPTRARGAALGFYQLFWAIGSFAAAVGLQIVSTMPVDKWRHAVYSMWFFIGLAAIVLAIIPETPRFYAIRGKHDKGKRNLKWVNGSVPDYDVDHEYAIIMKEIEDGRILADKQKDVTLLDCFRGTNLRRTIIAIVPFQNQLWAGSPVVFSYTSYFFQQAGLAKPFLATVAVNTVLVAFVAISFYTTERIGRRPLLIWCGLAMVPCLFIVGGVLKMPSTPATGAAMIAVACIWVALYASSAGPLAFVFLAECSTVILRAKTANMGALGNALIGLVTTYCTPLMLSSPKFGVANTMFLYGSTAAASLVVMWFVVPETKNRSYVELDEMFQLQVPTRKFATFETSIDRAKRGEGV